MPTDPVNHDFSLPKKQSKKGILLLALMEITQIWKQILPLVIVAFFKKSVGISIVLAIFVAVLLYFLGRALLSYYHFTYWIDTSTKDFYIKKGILNKSTLVIKKENIQEVNIQQSFWHKLLGIYQLEIDCPGDKLKELKVQAISHQEALNLKFYLQGDNTSVKEDKDVEVYQALEPNRITVSAIIKHGLTSNYTRNFLVFFVFGGYLFNKVSEFKELIVWEDWIDTKGVESNFHQLDWQSIAILGLGLLILMFLFGMVYNIILSVVKYYDFRIIKNKDFLTLEYGLFSTKSTMLGRSKIQKIITKQNYFQRKWRISQMEFRQIIKDTDIQSKKILIPACENKVVDDLQTFVFSEVPIFNYKIKALKRKLWLLHFKFLLIPIIIFIFASLFYQLHWAILLFYCVIAEGWVLLKYHNNQLMMNEKQMAVQSGIWDLKTETIAIDNVQIIKMSQYFWQKKSGIASFTVQTAGGNLFFRTISKMEVSKIINYCLYKIENKINTDKIKDEGLDTSC